MVVSNKIPRSAFHFLLGLVGISTLDVKALERATGPAVAQDDTEHSVCIKSESTSVSVQDKVLAWLDPGFGDMVLNFLRAK